MSVIDTLTEGIRQRSLANEGEALLNKWERTGLLEGLDDVQSNNMARLLENQAGQLLKETSTMAAGDVQGFSSVAFPIVRRVFGNLLAQDLVSVQPMSLPSGLIFFLDFVFSRDGGMDATGLENGRLGNLADTSIYGGGVVGAQLTGGISLKEALSQGSFYALNNGFSSPTGSGAVRANPYLTFERVVGTGLFATGTYGDAATQPGKELYKIMESDPSLVSGTSTYAVASVSASELSGLDQSDLRTIVVSGTNGLDKIGNGFHVRRLNKFSGSLKTDIILVAVDTNGDTTPANLLAGLSGAAGALPGLTASWMRTDTFEAVGGAIGAVRGATPWQLENNKGLPEIDIKVQSIAVTANTKKLKAKWSPELAQDLNAYHNLDAEVELTSILSEQIALEIDQEILTALVEEGTAAILFWSRKPGKFVNRDTGAVVNENLYPDFTGTVS
jgi:hypothetical protein